MAPPGSPAPQPDLRTQLAALLAGSQPRSNDAGPRRRKPHPLYSSGSAAAAASGGKRTCGAASQAGSARRSKSQPASPKGVTKVSPPRLSIVASAARRTQPRGAPASAHTSPAAAKPPLPVPQRPRPRGLDFGTAAAAAAAPTSQPTSPAPSQQQQLTPQVHTQGAPASPSQELLQLERLRLGSPAASPQASASPPAAHPSQQWQQQQPAPAQAPLSLSQELLQFERLRLDSPASSQPSASPTQAAASPWPQPLEPTSSGEDWCIPASPEVWADPATTTAATAAAAAAAPPAPSPRPGRPPEQQGHRSQAAGAPAAAAAAAAVTARAASAPPASPFGSSQERREEIAILSEMAEQGAGAWSSQEGETQLPATQPLCQPSPWDAGGAAAASPAPTATATAEPAAAWPGTQLGSSSQQHQQEQDAMRRLTSQELAALYDPWSQPEDAEEEARRRQQQELEEQQHAALLQSLEQQGGGQVSPEPEEAQECPTSPAQPSWQQQYQQHDAGLSQWASVGWQGSQQQQQQPQQQQAGLNQWAAVGRQAPSQQQLEQATPVEPPQLTPAVPDTGAWWLSPGTRQRKLDKLHDEDSLVAATCPAAALHGVRESFGTQREAFEAADAHNQRWMPQLRQPTIIMSQVPEADLLPRDGGGSGAGQQAASTSSGREAASSSGGGASSGRQQPGAGQEAESQQQQPSAAPLDFLSRFKAGALPPADSADYNTAPLAPLHKKQRAQAEEEARREVAQAEQREAARQAYLATLREMQEAAAAAAAARQQQQAQQQQQQAQPQAQQQQQACVTPGSSGGSRAPASPLYVPAWEGLHEEGVRVFCVQRRARSGAYYRTFSAASLPAVWALFRRTPPGERHWYEVVREGRPAHLYFDLEFPAPLNPQADGDAMVDRLLAHVAAQLRRHYGLGLDPRCVYELDSSTPAKFSRHLTVRLPGHAFATNHAMGKFVGQVVAAAGEELTVVRSEHEGPHQRGPFVDMAVYSRNRHWRMPFCCKGGKAAVLRPTRRYAAAPGGAALNPAHVFLDALVCLVDPGARLLEMPDPLPRGRGRGGRHGRLETLPVSPGSGPRVTWKHDGGDDALPADEMAEVQRLAEAALPFIERVAAQRAGGAPARARSMAFCGAGAAVAYSMVGPGSHYCENIGRPHASNHVFFLVDFRRAAYAQKCHDPDCARFRSGWMPLPPALRPAAQRTPPPPSPDSSAARSGQ